MKLAVCELPDGLHLDSAEWAQLKNALKRERPDLLILNEMPIGEWIAEEPVFNSQVAHAFTTAHDALISELIELPCASFGSRPVHGPVRMANEAFLISDGIYKAAHHKHYFPQEPGWFEREWFAPVLPGFECVAHRAFRVGALLCTELMFNEWARHYRRAGANIIAVPRAAGSLNTKWHAAASMAAVVSGCYVVSSNRAEDPSRPKGLFGGQGFVYAPSGELIAKTSAVSPIAFVEIDLDLVAKAQSEYPCYVTELGLKN